MLRGKENRGISRKIHVRVYVFIARERVYTDPPQEIHFLYSENPTSCDVLVSTPTCVFSFPPYEIRIHSILLIFSHVGLLIIFLNVYKKCSY